MPIATENRQPASPSSFVRLAARRPVASFLVMIYAITWTVFLPVVLQARGLLALSVDLSEGLAFNAVLAIASILGIALPALLVTSATSGKSGVQDLLSRCLRWRVGVHWYLIALLGFLAAMLLVASVFQGLAPLKSLVEKWPLFFTLFLPEVLFPFLFIGVRVASGQDRPFDMDIGSERQVINNADLHRNLLDSFGEVVGPWAHVTQWPRLFPGSDTDRFDNAIRYWYYIYE